MRSDKELEKFVKIFLNKNNIVNIVFVIQEHISREEQIRIAELVKKGISIFSKKHPYQGQSVLIDFSLSRARNINYYVPSEARAIYVKIIANNKSGRVAYVSKDILIRTVIKFIFVVIGKKNVKSFISKKKALDWLKKIKSK